MTSSGEYFCTTEPIQIPSDSRHKGYSVVNFDDINLILKVESRVEIEEVDDPTEGNRNITLTLTLALSLSRPVSDVVLSTPQLQRLLIEDEPRLRRSAQFVVTKEALILRADQTYPIARGKQSLCMECGLSISLPTQNRESSISC